MNEPEFDEEDFFCGNDDDIFTVEELCSELGTDVRFGLTQEVAEDRLLRDGRNVSDLEKRGHYKLRIIHGVSCGVTLLFLLAAAFSVLEFIILYVGYGEFHAEGLVVTIALVFDALFIGISSFLQSRDIKFMEAFPNLSHRMTEVIRSGQSALIPAEEVVVGDLILMKYGEPVPADVKIVESQSFKVDNFALTGVHNPQPVSENAEETVAYYSAAVVEGTARGIVLRTGRRRLIAKIFSTRIDSVVLCPITKIVLRYLNISAVLAAVIGFVIFWVFWRGSIWRSALDALFFALLVVLSFVPGSLLRTVLIACSIYRRKMTLKNCVIKKKLVVQRLPFLQTICLNKPGILTQNNITVANLWYDMKTVEVSQGIKLSGREKRSATFKILSQSAALCNDAYHRKDNVEKVSGSADEVAIFKFLNAIIGRKVEFLRQASPKLYSAPYLRYCYLTVRHSVNGPLLIIISGPPELLLDKCKTYIMTGNRVDIDDSFRNAIDKACVHFARFGETITCYIQQEILEHPEDFQRFKPPDSGYEFVGLISLHDPPRPNIANVVAICKKAGIRVILTTNDHPISARSFARHIGVISAENQTLEEEAESNKRDKKSIAAVIVDGQQLHKATRSGIERLMSRYPEVVFARTTPLQNLMLVATCQKDGAVVAVIGDGVHDVVAMKKADVSISLCTEGGCSDTKADIYLTDDSSTSLPECIQEGRAIIDNLKKSIAYTLTPITPSLLSVFAYGALGVPMPASPVGLIIVGFLTDLFPAVALVFEKSDSNVMSRPPQKIAEGRLLSRQLIFYACFQLGMIEFFGCFFTYSIIMSEFGWTLGSLVGIRDRWDSRAVTDLEDALGQTWTYEGRKEVEATSQTGFFFALVLMQCANVIACRTQTTSIVEMKNLNRLVFFSILVSVSITFCIIYLPFVNVLTGMRLLSIVWWIVPLPFLLLLIAYDEAKKYIVRKSPHGWFARETIY